MPGTRTSPNGSTAAPAPVAAPTPGLPRLPQLPRRRRPAFVALAVALLAAGCGLGAVLTAADVTRARVGADPALRPVPAGELGAVLGRRAAVPLRPGTLLTRDEVTTAVAPAAGQQLLGVALKAGQLPATGVAPGTPVVLVGTPGGGNANPAGGGAPAAAVRIAATVHALSAAASGGGAVVDLLVDDRDATAAAQAAATGSVALLVQRGGSGG